MSGNLARGNRQIQQHASGYTPPRIMNAPLLFPHLHKGSSFAAIRRFSLALLMLPFLLTGCGSQKREIERANQICLQHDEAITAALLCHVQGKDMALRAMALVSDIKAESGSMEWQKIMAEADELTETANANCERGMRLSREVEMAIHKDAAAKKVRPQVMQEILQAYRAAKLQTMSST
ncbi:MAG TPA: hypothetical protein PK322_03235 [Opitutaceae bacterium]|nr:hypothetical protein [Opitutaceae bacterium]